MAEDWPVDRVALSDGELKRSAESRGEDFRSATTRPGPLARPQIPNPSPFWLSPAFGLIVVVSAMAHFQVDEMRPNPWFVSFLLACATPMMAKLINTGPKSIAVGPDGSLSENVVKTEVGFGGYLSGAKKVVVPIIAVAFESSAKAKTSTGGSTGYTTHSLETRLSVDEKTMQSISDELQAIVEQDLAKAGFEVLPKDTLDQDSLWTGIPKDGKPGVEVGDNFLSGFGGNGVMNRWYTAGHRPLFGTGSGGALDSVATLLKIAKQKQVTILAYRFKIQYSQIDAQNHVFYSSVKGKNQLHMLSADLSVVTPDHILGGLVKLKADLTAGSDYVESSSGDKGSYLITANPERYKEGSLALVKAVSPQFAQLLRKAQ